MIKQCDITSIKLVCFVKKRAYFDLNSIWIEFFLANVWLMILKLLLWLYWKLLNIFRLLQEKNCKYNFFSTHLKFESKSCSQFSQLVKTSIHLPETTILFFDLKLQLKWTSKVTEQLIAQIFVTHLKKPVLLWFILSGTNHYVKFSHLDSSYVL